MKKYPVLYAGPHLRIQKRCHVYTVFVLSACTGFYERVPPMISLHVRNVEERAESLAVETLRTYRPIFASTAY